MPHSRLTLLALVVWGLGALAWGLDAPPAVRGLLCLPAVLWAPGLGFARRLGRDGGPLQVALDAAWIGVGLAVVDVVLARTFSPTGTTLLALSGLWLVLGEVLARSRRVSGRTSTVAWGGVVAAVLLIALGAGLHLESLSRPLDAHWWLEGTETLTEAGPEWSPGEGWSEVTRPGWEEAGAGRLVDPEGDGGELVLASAGELVVAVRGATGTSLRIGTREVEVTPDLHEPDDPTPVPQYLLRGVAALRVSLEAGPVPLEIESSGPVVAYVLPSVDAIWAVHHEGDLRFTHKWQILNIVENQRWAAELLTWRKLTINQPPLWSHVLAHGVALVDVDLASANGLLLWVLVLLAATGVRLVEVLAPRASPAAFALPGLYALVHLELMVEPASTTFPDSLYAAALLAGLLSLCLADPWRVATLGLFAGLLRYPGTIALTLAAGVQRLVLRRTATRGLLALRGTVLAVAVALGVAALVSSQFQHWLEILWFETVPEHYANNQEAAPIWQRPLQFYGRWLYYTGGGLALALAVLRDRGARFVFGSALVYSLLLCTIDHFPTHYFLPLVAMTGVTLAVGSSRLRGPVLRHGVPVLAALGALAWLTVGRIL